MPSDEYISIVYQNVRGINSKLTNLYADSFGFSYHIIIFTETWLQDKINNPEILCGKYQIYRCDRSDKTKKTGGGVLIAVSADLSSERISCSFDNDIEFVAVKIRLRCKTLFISCSYIAPCSAVQTYAEHVSAIKTSFVTSKSSDILAVFGDFNLPTISWNQSLDSNNLEPIVVNGCVNECIESLLSYGLCQVNHIYNPYGRLLDLIFVNQPSEVSLFSSIPVAYPEDRYHPTIELQIVLPSISLPVAPRVIESKREYCFSKTDYVRLNSLLSAVQWDYVFSSDNLDVNIRAFYETLHACISQTVPKASYHRDTGPPWNNGNLARAKNRKSKLYKRYTKSRASIDFCNYTIARSEYNIVNKRAYGEYLVSMKGRLRNDPKSFYKFVNSKRRSSGLPNSMKFGPNVANDDMSISNLFADFFSTTYSEKKYDHSVSYPYDVFESYPINVLSVSETTVLDALRRLRITYSPGPDGIPSNILKFCADSLFDPLTRIFNDSLHTGYLPSLWKDSFIIPLFKSGSKIEVSNYRGIAKLSAIPKLLEKIMTDNLSHLIAPFLSTHQHGFRKSRSTITNILELTTLVNDGFRARMQTDAIYTDFSKAFDKVNHDLLLMKLNSMGFSNLLLKWLNCYLSDRTQRVKFRNTISREIEVLSGVPQGSHLGPVLFILFINDLPTVVQHSNVLMYADDVKIFRSFRDPNEYDLLQTDLDNFSTWCKVNLMELNILKCKQMSFFRSGRMQIPYFLNEVQLESVESFLDLGILLDRRLNFRLHISMTINKAYGALGFMKRWSKEFSDPSVTKRLYVSLVRPILEYGSVIWDPCYTIHINMVESVQKQFLLFCLRARGWGPRDLPSYEFRLGLIKLPTLRSRRVMLGISFLMGSIQGTLNSDFIVNRLRFNVPSVRTRNYQLIHVEYFRTNCANNDPFRRLCVQFNRYYGIIELSENRDTLKRKIILLLNT